MKLRVLTYNIHKGFSIFGNNFVLQEIKHALETTHADILFLQEVVGESSRHARTVKNWPRLSQFEFIADTVWPHYSYGKNAVFTSRHHGNAVLTKYPIIFKENLDISNHILEQRGLLHCQIEIPPLEKTIHLFNTHIDLLAGGRRKQLLKIRDRILSHTRADDPIILTGDFNDWSGEINRILKHRLDLDEAHLAVHGDTAKTFPSMFPFLALDRIYFRGLKVVDCEVLSFKPWDQLSDHLPILADFSF